MGTLADHHSSEKERLPIYHQQLSVLVPEEFLGRQEIFSIPSFGMVCNHGAGADRISSSKTGRIRGWR